MKEHKPTRCDYCERKTPWADLVLAKTTIHGGLKVCGACKTYLVAHGYVRP